MNENIFDKLDFGPLRPLLDNDDITDISFDNNGQTWGTFSNSRIS